MGEQGRDKVVVYVSGEGVGLDTVDPRAALELAAAYVELMLRLAEEHDQELDLHGLELLEGSVGVAFGSATPKLAHAAAREASEIVRGQEEPPSGKVERAAARVERALYAMPEGYSGNVVAGPWKAPLTPARQPPETTDFLSATTLRAMPFRVGGKIPKVWFKSESEARPFSVTTDQKSARDVARYLYEEVEVTFRYVRDEEGAITDGVLESFVPVEQMDDEAAKWRAWFREAGKDWEDVTDVDRELGRDEEGD